MKTAQKPARSVAYADSGVDIDAGNALVEAIKPLVRATRRPGADDGHLRIERQAAVVAHAAEPGDIGRIDADGCVTITGRQKEILVLSNGKNISYAPIEQALCASRYIEHAYVVGDGRNFASVLLIPHRANLMRHAGERGIGEGEVLQSPEIHALFSEELARHQSQFSRFEQVKRFGFLSEEALLDAELVTPTQKVRRNVLEQKYFAWIERLYHEDRILVIPPPSKP